MGNISDHKDPHGCIGGENDSPGWAGLLDDLNARLEAIDPNYTWVQIKQKFCELVVYLGPHNMARCGCTGYTDCRMQHAIQSAAQVSVTTCEECGGWAAARNYGVISCETCELEHNAKRELRRHKNVVTVATTGSCGRREG